MLNAYALGSTVRLSLSFTVNAALSTPTTLTIEMRGPDGTLQDLSPNLVSDGVGRAHVDVLPTLPGPYYYYATGAGFAALPPAAQVAQEATFYIEPSRTLNQ